MTRTKLFPLGLVLISRGIEFVLERSHLTRNALEPYLCRHQTGDWSEMTEDDQKENAYSVDKYLRVFSAYWMKEAGVKIWIITEADRGVTTCLLPEEY